MCFGAIAWCDFTWDAFATLITGLSAVGGAVAVGMRQMRILHQQTAIQEQQLRSELFDRRYRVFERAEGFLLDVFASGDRPSREAQLEFRTAMGEARFLFDQKVWAGLDEIWQKWAAYQVLKATMKSTFDREGHHGDGNPEKEANSLLWFHDRTNTLAELFDELRLSTPMKK